MNLNELEKSDLENILVRGQTVWYNDLEFTRTLSTKNEVKPEEFYIGSISVYSYYITVTLVSVTNPKQKIHAFVSYRSLNSRFSKTREESIYQYNHKLDNGIEIINSGLESYKIKLEHMFSRWSMKLLPPSVKIVSLESIRENPKLKSKIYAFGYENIYRTGNVPSYIGNTDSVCIYDSAILVEGDWRSSYSNWVSNDDYGTNVMNTFYPTVGNLYLDYCRDKELILDRYSKVMDKAIKRLEKKKEI